MATIRRPYGPSADDKKYDEPGKGVHTGPGRLLRSIRSVRRRRLFLGLLAVCLLYLFFKNIPDDVPSVSKRYDSRYGALRPSVVDQRPLPESASTNHNPTTSTQTYDGPVRFYNLAQSLRGLWFGSSTKGNVLFAVSNLKSTSPIMVAACGMSQQNRTQVHVAFMGRKEIIFKDVLSINGIPESECSIQWHDARPDYAEESTEERMQHGVNGALGHISNVVPLDAVFVHDNDAKEDDFLLTSIQTKAKELRLPVISLPANGRDALPWVLSLDAPSLRHWGHVSVDIIVRAVPETAAPLLRLLHSIKNADYTGLSYPRIIVELPAKADPFLIDRLSGFRWPPGSSQSESQLVVRRRIDSKHMTPVLASLRTIESFYPVGSPTSHVLVLHPSAELSPSYYQFLMFSLLEFKYSAPLEQISGSLMGISLDLPKHDLNQKPRLAPTVDKEVPLMLWQTPSADATLYFGDKWLELHEFLSNRITGDEDLLQSVPKSPPLSQDHPAWLKVVLEMMQARGYYMLYPILQDKKSSIVTIHQELHHNPEEYADLSSDEEKKQNKDTLSLEKDDVVTLLKPKIEPTVEKSMISSSSFASLLGLKAQESQAGLWPDVNTIPIYSYDGRRLSWAESEAEADSFAERFALSVGGCSSSDSRSKETGSMGWLFCGQR